MQREKAQKLHGRGRVLFSFESQLRRSIGTRREGTGKRDRPQSKQPRHRSLSARAAALAVLSSCHGRCMSWLAVSLPSFHISFFCCRRVVKGRLPRARALPRVFVVTRVQSCGALGSIRKRRQASNEARVVVGFWDCNSNSFIQHCT